MRECNSNDLGLDALFSQALRDAATACPAQSSGARPPPPPTGTTTAAQCAALATTEIPTMQTLCCKGSECGVRAIRKCSSACAEVYVPFFTQCGARSFPQANMPNLAALSQLCSDSHPSTGGGH